MRIKIYDHQYSRRHFLKGLGVAGVLMPLWDAIAQDGDVSKAYPDELKSIEMYTKGKLKAGDTITSENVDAVKDLLEPIKYLQVSKMGRRLRLAETTTDVMRLSPWEYVEASVRNRGQAKFDERGNVVTQAGAPWIGGHPFPASVNPLELMAGLTLSWGRHDSSIYAMKEYDLTPQGDVAFEYQSVWAEMATTGRIKLEPKPHLPGRENKLRFQSVFFVGPDSVKGTSYLNVWSYDQHAFPELYGYLPVFRRIRQFPTDQRFEPLVPGSALYLSDAWCAGDPLYTWGNYRVVGRGPCLASVSHSWAQDHPNWEHTTHGGPKGNTFWDTTVELVPEAVIVEAEPTGFPRAPVGKKRVWFDVRTQLPIAMVSYDRRGEPYRSFDGSFSVYEANGKSVMDGAHPYWSWTHVHAFDVQAGRMTRLEQVRAVPGGHVSSANDSTIYDRYLTNAALMRFGSA